MTQKIKVNYEIAKVIAGYAYGKGRPLSDAEVASSYGVRTTSLITKVLLGKAVSKPVLQAIFEFIRDTDSNLYQQVQEYEPVTELQTQEGA